MQYVYRTRTVILSGGTESRVYFLRQYIHTWYSHLTLLSLDTSFLMGAQKRAAQRARGAPHPKTRMGTALQRATFVKLAAKDEPVETKPKPKN